MIRKRIIVEWTLVLFLVSLLMSSTTLLSTKSQSQRIVGSHKNISYRCLGVINGKEIKVNGEVNLNGARCVIPNSFTLNIDGGIVKNGTLIGTNTRILWKGTVFSRVTIKGSWIVPQISSEMFENLSYTNSLKDLIALTNPEVDNIVKISKGEYCIEILKKQGRGLILNSHTTLVFDGIIRLKPNAHGNYAILYVQGNDVHIKGTGMIIGDRQSHLGKDGEWGMGIRFRGVRRGTIDGLRISDCWGDCIYIGGKSRDIIVKNCHLEGSRRQGISITSAEDVTIRNCYITKIGGTSPGYGIDIEPNKGDTCRNIIIDNVRSINNKGGLEVFCKAENAYVTDVFFRNSEVKKCIRLPMRLVNCNNIVIENCRFPTKKKALYENVNNLLKKDNLYLNE